MAGKKDATRDATRTIMVERTSTSKASVTKHGAGVPVALRCFPLRPSTVFSFYILFLLPSSLSLTPPPIFFPSPVTTSCTPTDPFFLALLPCSFASPLDLLLTLLSSPSSFPPPPLLLFLLPCPLPPVSSCLC